MVHGVNLQIFMQIKGVLENSPVIFSKLSQFQTLSLLVAEAILTGLLLFHFEATQCKNHFDMSADPDQVSHNVKLCQGLHCC